MGLRLPSWGGQLARPVSIRHSAGVMLSESQGSSWQLLQAGGGLGAPTVAITPPTAGSASPSCRSPDAPKTVLY